MIIGLSWVYCKCLVSLVNPTFLIQNGLCPRASLFLRACSFQFCPGLLVLEWEGVAPAATSRPCSLHLFPLETVHVEMITILLYHLFSSLRATTQYFSFWLITTFRKMYAQLHSWYFVLTHTNTYTLVPSIPDIPMSIIPTINVRGYLP